MQLSGWFAKLKSHSQLESFAFQDANNKNAQLFVKRDDLIDREISGNKLRKLEGNLLVAKSLGVSKLVTYGGAYSNHLLASAAAANAVGIPVIGRVRGEELHSQSNQLLRRCSDLGMQLEFLSRSVYTKEKHQTGLHSVEGKATWIIPEGGANPEGIWGCTEIYQEAVNQNKGQHFDAVFIAQGTTTTSLGILASIPATTQLYVIPVLKGFDSLSEMQALAASAKTNPLTAHLQFNWKQVTILDTYHHGGYAKTTPELLHFTSAFNTTQQFPIEPTYTAKALFALQDHLPSLKPQIQTILFIHTGGIRAID